MSRFIECDTPNCPEKTPLLAADAPTKGWTTGGGDFCPKCSASRPKPVQKMSEEEKLVRRLLGRERGLSMKETRFIEDMGRRVLDEKRPMTVDQLRWARDIDDRLDL